MSRYSVISEVFIGDPIKLRKDIYQHWLNGTSVSDAVKDIKEKSNPEPIVNMNVYTLIYEDVLDSVRRVLGDIIV